jgi:hypothetical protein
MADNAESSEKQNFVGEKKEMDIVLYPVERLI